MSLNLQQISNTGKKRALADTVIPLGDSETPLDLDRDRTAFFPPGKGPNPTARVIPIKERNIKMLKNDLILRNPLRFLGHESDDIIGNGGFGAVLARAGVGKTAFLVQIALNILLRNRNVLHISLGDPVKKVALWYKEVFNLIADQYDISRAHHLWESLLPHRFIMTFKAEEFSVPKLEERLTDLVEQNIFKPDMILLDGLTFDGSVNETLQPLKSLAEEHLMHVWFAVRTHRHEAPGPKGIPAQMENITDLFNVIIQLLPEGNEIHIKGLKGGVSESEHQTLLLDPSTMLIKYTNSE